MAALSHRRPTQVLPSCAVPTRGSAIGMRTAAQLIRIEATLAVASILGSRKPGMPAKASSRVLCYERAGSMCLTPS